MTDTRNLMHSPSYGNLQAVAKTDDFRFIETYHIILSFKIGKNISSYITTLFVVLRIGSDLNTYDLFPVRLIVFYVRFEILTVMVVKSPIFWDITLYSQLKDNQRFGRTCRVHLQGRKMCQARHQHEVV
jgi:hypothetical protein